MKTNYVLLLIVVCFLNQSNSQSDIENFKNFKSFKTLLSHTDTVPDYALKTKPFKLKGVLYLEDGTTPAANHIITINQADENGDFVFTKDGRNKILKHRAQIETDMNGNFTFYTFVPGGDRLYNQLQEIYVKVETPEGNEYALPTLFFDDDPLLSKRCRKKLKKKNESDRILHLTQKNKKWITSKNIILNKSNPL